MSSSYGLATNTSFLSISESCIYSKTGKSFRDALLNPVVNRPLVELVRGLETSDDTVAIAQLSCCYWQGICSTQT